MDQNSHFILIRSKNTGYVQFEVNVLHHAAYTFISNCVSKKKVCVVLLLAAMFPGQMMQFEHTEDQRDSRHNQHEHYEDVFFCRPGDVTVDWVWTRPGLRQEQEKEQLYNCALRSDC